MENIVEEMEKKCENCGHTKHDHYRPVRNPNYSDLRTKAGVCKHKGCTCSKFKDPSKK